MKTTIIKCWVVAALSLSNFIVTAAEPPPTSAIAARTIIELWKLKKFDKIESYVAQLSKQYPKRVCVAISVAFVDFIMHGDVDKAQQKIGLVRSGITSANIATSDKFNDSLNTQILGFSIIDNAFTSQGLTRADVKRTHSVLDTRNGYGSKIPELLELMGLAPDADLP